MFCSENVQESKAADTPSRLSDAVVVTVELDYLKHYMARRSSVTPTASTRATVARLGPGYVLLMFRLAGMAFLAVIKKLLRPGVSFWRRATEMDFGRLPKRGRDLYIYTFPLQFLLLIWILAGYMGFVEGGSDVSSSLASNRLPGDMVLNFLFQVIVIIVDRVAYLRRSLKLKLGLHVTAMVYVHVKVFQTFPSVSGVPFGTNSSLVVFYLCFLLYFIVSALQIHLGYSRMPPQDSLKQYRQPYGVMFKCVVGLVGWLTSKRDGCCVLYVAQGVLRHAIPARAATAD